MTAGPRKAPAAPERLQKVLSRAGVASRREAERLMREGRVSINGRITTEMGVKVGPQDELRVEGKLIDFAPEMHYVLLHKPSGTVSTRSDPERRMTVLDLLPEDLKGVFPVGRLDWSSEGLLLLTNDGELANRLMHPRYGVERVYEVKVDGRVEPTDPRIRKMLRGVPIGPGVVGRVKSVVFTGNTSKHSWYRLILTEGKNREIRRICDAIGLEVLKLKRIAYGPLVLGTLPRGAYRELTPHEVQKLKHIIHGEEAAAPKPKPKRRIGARTEGENAGSEGKRGTRRRGGEAKTESGKGTRSAGPRKKDGGRPAAKRRA